MKPKTWASDIMDRAVAFVGKTGPTASSAWTMASRT